MATLIIVEFGNIQAYPTTESAQIAKTPPVAIQAMALTSTSSTSCAAFNGNTQIVRLQSDTNCYITFGALGTSVATAVATSMPLSAGQPEYFGVNGGAGTSVLAALSAS